MEPKEMLELIRKDESFKEWKKINKDSYLVHIFKMLDSANIHEAQVGFYDKKSRRITTFVVNEDSKNITINPDSEIFKDNNDHIPELKIDGVKASIDSVIERIAGIMKNKYSHHPADKRFFLLQTTKEGTVWNFTLVTKTFHVINIRLDAFTDDVRSEKISSIFEFKGSA